MKLKILKKKNVAVGWGGGLGGTKWQIEQHDAGGSDFHGFSPVSCPSSAVELGKEAQPNENAGDQLTQDEIQLIT